MITTTTGSVILVVVLVLIAVSAMVWTSAHAKRQTTRLKSRFGDEYTHTVRRLGSRWRAEADLRQREARVSKLKIVPLARQDAARFSAAWMRLQGRFVDDPRAAVAEADKLVTELMTARGYPMGDFESQAADISVDHPGVVEAYRAAKEIALRDAKGEADTEDLRKAVVHYRTLFADLLEVHATPVPQPASHTIAVQS